MFRPTLLAFCFLAAASASASAAAAAADSPKESSPPPPPPPPDDDDDDDDKRVKIDLYYESQCPGCRDTITRSFKEAYAAPDFLKMAMVTFVPFGNAREEAEKTEQSKKNTPHRFVCQHGPSECIYNVMESCALSKIECPHQQFRFIDCVENYDEDRASEQNYDAVLTSWAALTGMQPDVADGVLRCYKGPEGNALEHEMARKTGDLHPSHEYVPWIVTNGKHDDKVQDRVMSSLLEYVCDVYDGPHRSPGCPREGRGGGGGALRTPAAAAAVAEIGISSTLDGRVCYSNAAAESVELQ